jgi:hypothetical protein
MWYMTSDSDAAGRDQDHGEEFAELSIISYLHSFSDRDDRLFIYFVDHGEELTGHICVHSDTISDTELGLWVGSIATGASGWSRLVTIVDCCYSGTHVLDLDGANRIAISSSSSDEPALAWADGLTIFADIFFASLAAGETIDASTGAFMDAHDYLNEEFDVDPQMNDQIVGTYTP